MKKVLFMLNHLRRSNGVARALISLCNNLDLGKFDITIMPMYQLDEELAKELDPRIKIKKAFGFYFKGFNTITTHLPISLLYRLFIKEKFDIEVGFQTGLPTLLVGNSLNERAVHVAWMHGYELWKNCYKKCDKVLCVSKHNAERAMVEMNGEADVSCCYNLVEDKIISALSKEASGYTPIFDAPCFISVGRHSPEKGYVRLVKILRELRDEGLVCNLVLVGDGPQHDEIKEAVAKYKMGDAITLVGAQKNPHKFTAKSDLFICSSFSEGYSTACTEAAILGIPIITTSVAGGKEIIDDCECGILTGLDDDSLKAAIRKVLMERTLIDQWKDTMKRTSKKFSLESRRQVANEFFSRFYDLSEERINEKCSNFGV